MCSDLMYSDINLILRGEKVNFMYSDPPWGDGNLKYWQTINKKMTGAPTNPVNLKSFLDIIFSIARDHVTEITWMEYGIRWRGMIDDYSERYSLLKLARIESFYMSGNRLLPLDLYVFSKKPRVIDQDYVDSVAGRHGISTVRSAITPYAVPGKKILDPCCGMGYTAQVAVDNQMIFYGNELNAERLKKTIKRLV